MFKKYSLLTLLALSACGSSAANNNGDMGPPTPDLAGPAFVPPDLGPPPQGTAISAPQDQWTWVDFPDSACDDGSTTGIGIYNSSKSSNVLIFMNGGGACWDYLTCYQLKTASSGPFQAAQFQQFAQSTATGTVFDRSEAMNPFKDWSYVFIPYCTGDVHAGNNVATYTNPNSNPPVSNMYHHVGHANILAYLKRLGPTFASPGKMVVSGSSAGGFGSLLNYRYFRWYWPSIPMYLLDDSGPPLEEGDIPDGYIMAWLMEWRLDELLAQTCGDACMTDFSAGVPALSGAYPHDRLALLSSLQDKTISGYFLLSATGFQDDLLQTATDRLDPTSNFHYFFVTGNTHTMLGDVASFTSNGTALWTWLNQEISDDPTWASTKPAQ